MGVFKWWHERAGDGGEKMLSGCRQGMDSTEGNCKGLVSPKKRSKFGWLAAEQLWISECRCWPCEARAGQHWYTCLVPHSLSVSKAEKKKGRSATFYPLDNTPFLLPVDETQPPVFTSSMEPVGVSTEMALLSNILAAYAFITGRSGGHHLSGLFVDPQTSLCFTAT